jgi:LacI family transcriptional regulator
MPCAPRQPTIIDVARRAGYSKSAVSLVLRGATTVSAEARQRVLAAAAELGYRPNRLARGLRLARGQVVGMIVQDAQNPYFSDLIRRVEDVLLQHDYDVIICETGQDVRREEQALARLSGRAVDGMIVYPTDSRRLAASLAALQAGGVHCVLLGGDGIGNGLAFDRVEVAIHDGALAAMEHLIGLGHRRLAFVAGVSPQQPIPERSGAFQSALARHGIACSDDLIVHCGFRLQDGYEAGRELLSRPNRPTAVFAVNDLVAIGVLRAARELGLAVPRDLSVVGVDDIELAAYLNPPLTTVAQPINRIAEALGDLVLSGIRARRDPAVAPPSPRRIVLPTTLVVRGTSAPPGGNLNATN